MKMSIDNMILIAFNAFLIQNIILTKFLGICSFLGVSKNKSSALGMGLAVTFVITVSAVVSYFIYEFILIPYNIEYMRTIIFILVIACLVQLVEMVVKKYFKSLYSLLGIYLPLVTTNCAVLGVAILVTGKSYTFTQTLLISFFTALGYLASIFVFSSIRVKLEDSPIPEFLKGIPVGLFTAAIMSMIVLGLKTSLMVPI